MSRYYISPNFRSESGIAHYAHVFYKEVLKKRGYKHLAIESISEFWSKIINFNPGDEFFIEIGVDTHVERDVLYELIRRGIFIIDITLHDPPHLAFPYYRFKSDLMNKFSKFVQHQFNLFNFGRNYMRKIRRIFILSRTGLAMTYQFYKLDNLRFLPHILVEQPIDPKMKYTSRLRLLFTGFIGRRKGLGYALNVHRELLYKGYDIDFFIVGKPKGREAEHFYNYSINKYKIKTHFLGYIENFNFDNVLSGSNIVILPTNEYKYICPMSGNLLNALKFGNVVITTPVNAHREVIKHEQNGFFISYNLNDDLLLIENLLSNLSIVESVSKSALKYVSSNHSIDIVSRELEKGYLR